MRGLSSELRATFGHGPGGRTVLRDAYFTSPLKLTKTFPVAGPSLGCSATVMDVSPGLMDGDTYELAWTVEPGCSAAVTTQSYAKVHPCPRIGARQTTSIVVGAGASLVYAPQPTMLYADAAFRGTLDVELAPDASLLLFDALCAGRIHYGGGEAFRYALYDNDLRITAGGRLCAANRMVVCPAELPVAAVGAFESFTHVGTLYGFGPFVGADAVEALREAAAAAPVVAAGGVRCGVSLAARYGLTATALGGSAWQVQEALLAMGRAFVACAAERAPAECAPFAWPEG
ncbi:urease accessory protein UreD [Paenibacillus sp. TRM 82003]|nr:urease accessory protein UreD [Paenibacillus sp. TRM 82003]